MRLSLWGAGLTLLATLAAGCGSSPGTITGKVTYKGDPLPGGQVFFVPPEGEGHTVVATIQPNGTYTAENVPAGEVTVCVETESLNPVSGGASGPRYKPPEGADTSVYDPSVQAGSGGKYVAIPTEYGDPKTSKLRYTVESGSQTHNIELQ